MAFHRSAARARAAAAITGSALPFGALAHAGHGAPAGHVHVSETVVAFPGLGPFWLVVAVAVVAAVAIWRAR